MTRPPWIHRWHSICDGIAHSHIPVGSNPHHIMNTTGQHTDTMEKCIDTCNSLLRGELSAIETYGQAIEKYADEPVVDELRRIHSEHTDSALRLSANVRDMGGKPDTDSGAWGVFAAAIQGTANLFGNGSAIESLQRGEEMGCNGYEEALRENDLLPECAKMIREELLPRTRRHVADLEQLSQST